MVDEFGWFQCGAWVLLSFNVFVVFCCCLVVAFDSFVPFVSYCVMFAYMSICCLVSFDCSRCAAIVSSFVGLRCFLVGCVASWFCSVDYCRSKCYFDDSAVSRPCRMCLKTFLVFLPGFASVLQCGSVS